MKKKKNALIKDFCMEIRKSTGRFLSIFFIVALGASLFSGIHATKPDMILSGDAYVDENKLMDIKIVSTYGLTDSDVTAIGNLPDIELAVGSYSVDVLCQSGDDMAVIHVMSHLDNMNKVTVEKGRLPKNKKECLVDQDFLKESGYKIGDTLKLESGTSADITDTLGTTEFKIVGSGSNPQYFALDRGSSTIGNGSVRGFLVISPDAFTLEVYTEVFAFVKGAVEATAFTEEYDKLVEEAIEQIQLVQNVRCEVRRNELAENAMLEINSARNELSEKKSEAEKEISAGKDKLNNAEVDIKLGKAQIESGKAEIAKGKQELEEGKKQLEDTKKAYATAKEELEKQKSELEDSIADLEKQIQNMEPGAQAVAQATIDRMKKSVENLEKQIETLTVEYEKEIAKAEKEIADAELLIKEKEEEIAKAEKQLKAGEKELVSGKNELENAEDELNQQVTEGTEELEKAEDEVSNIELPVWYIFDRSSIPEYTGYGDNAERMAALAIVFPSIFFLVAALISLTTMTRMVEEQRVQIGTLKALGYSNKAIMMKYLSYALLATIGGSIFGVLVGEKIFPFVIIVAYKIMYVHIPHVLTPYRWGYGIAAMLIATLCTGGATLISCYKELVAAPAILMRPEAPSGGKRTWIERIGFLWKHLNFSWKSSLRNLFRYKKRFFMTLIGIGGCMGLLIVGYGLRDSITSVATIQYEELQTYQANAYISEEMSGETREELLAFLDEHKDVTSYMSGHMSSITTEYEEEKVDAYLTVLKDEEKVEDFFVFRNRRTKEKYTLSEKGIILSEKTADMLGANVGDTITLSEDGINEHDVKIIAICENYVSHYVYMTEAQYKEIYGEEAYHNILLIKSESKKSRLEKLGEQILKYDSVLNVQYTENLSGQLNDMLGALDRVMIVLIVVAGMLSFVVLYNLNNINITERRRELATLKVLGFHDIEVALYVYRENILLTFLGALVGCVMGKLLHYFTITTVEVDVAMFGRQIFWSSYVIAALFTFGFAIFVNWMMYFKLKKINMVESLKSVE